MASILVPLAQGCEELEAVTIIDLLRRAGLDVVTAGLQPGPVRASRGVNLLPDTTLDEVMARDFDMVVLPGGLPGADHLNADPRIHVLLQRCVENQGHAAALCAAPKVLQQSGLLAGRRFTAYPGAMQEVSSGTLTGTAVEQDGPVITGRGPGTAMDFALALIEVLAGRAQRDQVEQGLVR